MWPLLMLSLALNVVAPASLTARATHAEATIVRMIEQTRTEHGLTKLGFSPTLRAAGRRQAVRMSKRETIFHATPLHFHVTGGWRLLGENVGMASAPEDVFIYFMQSPEHRALILDPTFRDIGAGVSIRDDTFYVSVVFGAP